MCNKTLLYGFPATLLTLLGNTIVLSSAKAQITTDGTTNTNLTTTPNGVRIDNGNQAEGNLFHSFKEFSVPTGTEAVFNNSVDVVNIFSRVTGGNISNIEGLIRANGGANLFLINPAGILFGNNASLEIGGSFYGSTADSIIFPNGVEFSASNPQPILTVNAPIGLRFRDNPGDIVNQSTVNNFGLTVLPGNDLALVGGNITLAGGKITTFGGTGNIELAGVTDNSIVDLELENSNFKLGYSQVTGFKNIILDQDATIFTSNSSINLRGNQIVLNNGSNIGSDVDFGFLFDNLPINSDVAGNINIQARQLLINNRANIFTSTFTNKDAGNINLDIADSITIIGTGFTEIQNTLLEGAIIQRESLRIDQILENATGVLTGTGSTGTSGNINIKAASVQIQEGGLIGGTTLKEGSLGTIKLDLQDSLNVVGSMIFNNPLTDSTGTGNLVEIKTKNLTISDGGLISIGVFGAGDGGNLKIEASEQIDILRTPSNAFVATGVFANSVIGNGSAGNITIETKRLNLQDGGQITSSSGLVTSEGLFINQGGRGGNININVSESIEIFDAISDNSLLLFFTSGTFSNSFTENNAGNININTNSLSVTNGVISTGNFGQGNGGAIRINATDNITFDGTNSGAFSSASNILGFTDVTTGNAGDIDIITGFLSVTNGAQIFASTFGQGDAGAIRINATDNITFDGTNSGALSFSDSLNEITGNAGNITFNANSLSVTNGAQISASTSSQGDGGVIRINTTDSINIIGSNSGIFSSSEEFSLGDAGGIRINTNDFEIRNGQISVDSLGEGEEGTLVIATESLTLDNGSITANTEFGRGANVDLQINNNLILNNNSLISAQAFNDADGGNLSINSSVIVAFPSQKPNNGNDIIALAEMGRGGNILVKAEAILGDIEVRNANPGNGTNDLDASSEFQQNQISENIFVETNISETNLFESNQIVAQACQANQSTTENTNTFAIQGKGGVPPTPNSLLNAEILLGNKTPNTLNNSQLHHPKTNQIQPVKTAQGDIYPARGVIVKEDGTVNLTSYATNQLNQRLPINTSCHSTSTTQN